MNAGALGLLGLLALCQGAEAQGVNPPADPPASPNTCVAWDVAPAKRIELRNFCNGQRVKVWRKLDDDSSFTLSCPDQAKPAGYVELREYYTIAR